MEKWDPLNMELRSWVISKVLRLEQTSTSVIRAILRLFNEKSRILGTQSSSLSFKSKIDLLLDLEEIEKDEYNHLIKLMEIRNQFAHNHKAVSFESLDNINKDINKYLEKIPSKSNESNRESKLRQTFNELFEATLGKLAIIEIEYRSGIQKEIRKHINDLVVENLDEIWVNALKMRKERTPTRAKFPALDNTDQIENFHTYFQKAISEFKGKELEKLDGENLKSVFKQKETTEEILKRIDEKDEK
jgi:hypothetical protein